MSSQEIRNYLDLTSPISNLQNPNKIPLKDIRNSVDVKMNLMSEQSKNYNTPKIKKKGKCSINEGYSKTQQTTPLQQFSQLKANSIIYNIPELIPPEINFEVSNQLRNRINEIKSDIVTKFPSIKSSQYNTNKLQNIFSRRTVLKDLQDWLQQKLKNPPLTQEDSIEYKNMIMGVGMKEVIRLIGTRCNEQANIVNEIWELTWSICRQIILYLSKRAHKCEKILEEEAAFFRVGCQKRLKQSEEKLKQYKEQNDVLKERSQKLSKDLSKLRKKNKQLRLIKLNLQGMNQYLKQQFEETFKENLLLHLKTDPSNSNYRKIARQKYANLLDNKNKGQDQFKQFLGKIMKQHSKEGETEEVGQLELAVDINKFKQEEKNRKLDMENELLEMFKTYEQESQTYTIEKTNQFMQTQKTQIQELGTSTQCKQCEQFGTNTEQQKIQSSIKVKGGKKLKKQKKDITSPKNNDKRKNMRQKMSIDVEILKEENEDDEEDGKSRNWIRSMQHYKQELDEEQSKNPDQNGMSKSCIEEVVQDDISLGGQIQQNTRNKDQFEDKVKQISIKSRKQVLKSNVNIENISLASIKKVPQVKQDKVIINEIKMEGKSQAKLETSKKQKTMKSIKSIKVIKEEIKSIGTNLQIIREKQQKIESLQTNLIEIQQKYGNQMAKLEIQLLTKDQSIFSLSQEIKQLKQRLSQQLNKPHHQLVNTEVQTQTQSQPQTRTQPQPSIQINTLEHENSFNEDDQEVKHMVNLLHQKKYQQIYAILEAKLNLENDCTLNHIEQEDDEEQIKNESIIPEIITTKKRLSYQKKNIISVEDKRKQSINAKDIETIRDMIQQRQRQEQEANNSLDMSPAESKKIVSRRSSNSFSPGGNLNLHQFVIKRKKIQQQPIKPQIERNLSFVELCTKYFYTNSFGELGNANKQSGLTESSKRMIKEQYRQVYRQVMDSQSLDKNEKQMKITIEKCMNNLVKDLCKQIVAAQKQGFERMDELKNNYSAFPLLIINRFNRNYGVRKVASKHIKDLMLCLKGIRKYTDKYSIIASFMLASSSFMLTNNPILQYQDAELFFFYVLLTTLTDDMFTDLQVGQQQIATISMITKKHLTTDPNFLNNLYELPFVMQSERNSSFIHFYSKFITMYKDLYTQRINEMEFIYLALSKQSKQGKQGIVFEDFIKFLSVFSIKLGKQHQHEQQYSNQTWLSAIISKMTRILREERSGDSGIISRECFIKFLVKCPIFNFELINQYLNSIIPSEQFDLTDAQTQQKILSICEKYQFLGQIIKYVFGAQSLLEHELQFWIKFIKLYVLEKEVNLIMGNLVEGVLDPRTRSIILNESNKN